MNTEMDALVESSSEAPAVVGSTGKRVLAGALGLSALVVCASFPRARSGADSSLTGLIEKEQRIAITPSYPACSTAKENCLPSGCCQTSGHTCFMKTDKLALCNETCSQGKGWSCAIARDHSVPVQRTLDKSMYCFSFYTHDTGSTKTSHELELLQMQNKHGVSLFACDAWDVFSDTSVEIGNGYFTYKVEDTFNEFHKLKRKLSGTWVNWALFHQAWLGVRQLGKWEGKSWTVKVDADAVFVPSRLQGWLSDKSGESPHGIYFENCKNVQYGFFGNLEVMSNEATKVLTTYLEDCHAVYAPCAYDGCDWKYGAWGEDVYVQRCLDRHYVDKVEAFDMTLDGACAADRPADQKKNKKWHAEDCTQVTTAAVHPFKKPAEYFKCLSQMTNVNYA